MLSSVPARLVRVILAAVSLGMAGQCIAIDTIVVGGEVGYAPYETLDAAGEPVGFNIDLMRAIARATGNEVRFRLGNWEEMRDALQAGEVDVLAMFVSEEREQAVDFARTHLIVNHRIFIPTGAETIDHIEDLAGRSVIVQEEAWSHEFLQQSGMSLDLTLVENDSAGLRLLAKGEHDAALLTEHRSRHTLRTENLANLTVSGPPVLPVEYALAVRQGEEQLLETINAGLGKVMASGEFDRLYERWLQPLDDAGSSTSRVTVAITIALAAVLLLAVAWMVGRLIAYRRDMLRANEELAYLRRHDALTGLLSRHALEQELDALCQDASDREHSLLNINVDQFRVVNDTLGHGRADKLLRALAGRLGELLPSDALIARLGADEFAVLLPGISGDAAQALGEALLASLHDKPLVSSADSQPLTVSVGVVTFDRTEDSIARILRRADCARLAAKEDGGDQVHAWHPNDQRLAEKYGELGWVSRIQTALAEDRLALYWQAIVPVGAPPHRIVAIEVLVRMLPSEPGGEAIPAARFMPAAERYFITAQIDRWVIGSMLDWMEAHPEEVESLDRVNLNLSGRSLGDARFLAFLDRRSRRHVRLLPKLCLEVTETALISNLDQAREVLERLHRGGCRIALDDFGTGVSSMNYLRQLPVDYLKIDGSFVQGIDSDAEAFDFIKEINRLGHNMGKITVAECVETDGVRLRLAEAGIDLMQGYLVGYPAPLNQLKASLPIGVPG